LWITPGESGEPALKPRRVQLADGENAHAALRTAGTADQPVATPPRSVGKGSIEDLNEVAIPVG
jgi:hypothetical protein